MNPIRRTKQQQTDIIAKNLNNILKKNDMTQVELANAIGVSESAIGKWILGHNAPSMGNVQKIADHFSIPKALILEENTESYYVDVETQKIAQEIYEDKDLKLLFDAARDATPQDLQAVHSMLKALKAKEQGYDDY